MNTELDESYTWFLDSIEYKSTLYVYLSEGLKGPENKIKIADISLGLGSPLEVTSLSKTATVEFQEVLSWHCIDESATMYDENEVSEGGKFINTLTKSAYLDYVCANHQWYIDIKSPVKLYRLWTENEVIEVVAYAPPTIEVKFRS